MIKDLCALVELAQNPNSLEDLPALSLLIPEFRGYDTIKDTPFYRIMSKSRCSIFDVQYHFKDQYCGENAMALLLEVHDMCMDNRKVSDIFNKLYPYYYSYYLADREIYMEYNAKYYMNLGNYAIHGKTYQQFRQDEIKKAEFIEDCNARRVGVRCYTFHAAKGLEDDIVYMIDCDDFCIPNVRKLEEMVRKHCEMDVAREIRNERSLIYVACTRAKDELHIHYNDKLSSILTPNNEYLAYDMMYENFKPNYLDVEVFQEFYQGDV